MLLGLLNEGYFLGDFKILAFHNREFKIFADLNILAFQNPEFKISADIQDFSFPKSWIQDFGRF